jgi:hypothetical protein
MLELLGSLREMWPEAFLMQFVRIKNGFLFLFEILQHYPLVHVLFFSFCFSIFSLKIEVYNAQL